MKIFLPYTRVILRGQARYGGVFPLSIYSFIPAAGKKKRYLIDKIYCGTPVSIAEQIYLLCGQQPPHRFLASILVPLFLKYWLTPGLESYLTNESMYGRRGREKKKRDGPYGVSRPVNFPASRRTTQNTHTLFLSISARQSL